MTAEEIMGALLASIVGHGRVLIMKSGTGTIGS